MGVQVAGKGIEHRRRTGKSCGEQDAGEDAEEKPEQVFHVPAIAAPGRMECDSTDYLISGR